MKDATGNYIVPTYGLDPMGSGMGGGKWGGSDIKEYRNVEKWKPSDSKEADWLEWMKYAHPHQYSLYTGQTHNKLTGEFTPIPDDGYGGVPDAGPPLQSPTTPTPDEETPGDGTIPTGPINASGIATDFNLTGVENMYGYLKDKEEGTTYKPITDTYGTLTYSADGGRVPAAYGGRMGYAGGGDIRQRYLFGGLGKLFKGITKPFKGITRGIKKLTKSKAGKLAIMAALGFGVPGTPFKGMFGSGTGGLGDLFKNAWTSTKGIGLDQAGAAGAGEVGKGWFNRLASKAFLSDPTSKWSMENISPWKTTLFPAIAGGLYSAFSNKQKKPDWLIDWERRKAEADAYWAPRFEDAFAQGGRIGYAGGSDDLDIPLTSFEKALREMTKEEREEELEFLKGDERQQRYKMMSLINSQLARTWNYTVPLFYQRGIIDAMRLDLGLFPDQDIRDIRDTAKRWVSRKVYPHFKLDWLKYNKGEKSIAKKYDSALQSLALLKAS